ncbi:hypothetical protein PYCCODRAFT_1429821 [Trametes coccinea BRFM310]|uniref:Uncharacterized protein n=1 Tax=Trametes coccinea (strain BRFM310) TaxID=1353009 RepID=A0A1Y2J8E4_TRAC3|nr:hypothetical protein PYCCODRAFT_1429821 [Trametes coccinea BRFM310]
MRERTNERRLPPACRHHAQGKTFDVPHRAAALSPARTGSALSDSLLSSSAHATPAQMTSLTMSGIQCPPHTTPSPLDSAEPPATPPSAPHTAHRTGPSTRLDSTRRAAAPASPRLACGE